MSRWFRHYAGMARDDKLVRAAIKAGQSVERTVWVWAAILESAAEIDDGGRFELDTAEVAYFLRADEADIAGIVAALEAGGRIAGDCVVHWGDRQFQSDRSAERQRRHREKQKARGDDHRELCLEEDVRHSDDRVTALSRHGDAPETETHTEPETEIKKRESNARAPVDASHSEAAGPIPADWQPGETDWKAALTAGLAPKDIPAEAARFRDHNIAKGTVTVNISALWRVWLSRIADFGKAKPPPPAEGPIVGMTWVTEDDANWPKAAARHLSEKGKALFPGTSRHASGYGAFVPSDWLMGVAA